MSGPAGAGGEDQPSFEVFGVRGNPTAEEEEALLDALAELVARDQPASAAGAGPGRSAWKLAARLVARRAGILDIRTSLGAGAWPASARLPWTGRAHQGRHGRGDSR